MNRENIRAHRHLLLFSCPKKFDMFVEPDAAEKHSYFVRNITDIHEMTAQEQENYIHDIFKNRKKDIFSCFSVENFDLLYSFAKALSEPRPGSDGDNGTVSRTARGALVSNLAYCLTQIQGAIMSENNKQQRIFKEKNGDIPRAQQDTFNFFSALLRGVNNMIVCLLCRCITASVLHYVPADGEAPTTLTQQQQDKKEKETEKNKDVKRRRQKKAVRENANEEWDGVDVDALERVLRGLVDMVLPETQLIWSAEPIPVRDFIDDDDDDDDEEQRFDNEGKPIEPNYKNRHELGRPKNADGFPDPETIIAGIKIVTHLAGQKRVFVNEVHAANPLGKGVIGVLKVLGRVVAIRYEKSPAVRAAIESKRLAHLQQQLGTNSNEGDINNGNNKQQRNSHQPTPEELGAFDIGINRGNVKQDDAAAADQQQDEAAKQQQELELKKQQQRNAASSTPAADPRNVLVAPLLDVLLRVNVVEIAYEISKILVTLLLEYDILAKSTQPNDPNNRMTPEDFATMLYLQGGQQPPQQQQSQQAQNQNQQQQMMMMSSQQQQNPSGSSSDFSPQLSQTQTQQQPNAASGFAMFLAVGQDGTVSEPLVLAKLVSYFLEAIVRSGINAEPASREAKNVATFIEHLATTGGALPVIAKHAPILMPMLQSECQDSRKSCITLITQLVAERYTSQAHHSWAVAIQQVAAAAGGNYQQHQHQQLTTATTNGAANDDENTPLVQQHHQQHASLMQHNELSPDLVVLRDGYLGDLLQRTRDTNHFVRLHTIKAWERLVKARAVPRCYQLEIFNVAVSRLADRNYLVRCAALGLLRACIGSSWFSDHLSHETIGRRFHLEYNAMLKKVQDEVKHMMIVIAKSNVTKRIMSENPELASSASPNQQEELNNLIQKQMQQIHIDDHLVTLFATTKLKRMMKVMKQIMFDDAGGRTSGAGLLQHGVNSIEALRILDNNDNNKNNSVVDDADGGEALDSKTFEKLAALEARSKEIEEQSQMTVKQEASVGVSTVTTSSDMKYKNAIQQQHKYDLPVARLVFLETATQAIAQAELGLRLAVDMLASKTNKDITDAMQFIVAASACRLDSAPAACEKVLLLVFHHDPTITNAVCDAFVAVYYTSFDTMTTVSPQARDLARVQKIVSLLSDSSEGTFAAIERIIDLLSSRIKTRDQGSAASAQAAGLLAQARGLNVRAAASRANSNLFFSRDFFDANWGMIDGTLDPHVTPLARRTALRFYGALARCEPREIQSRRPDIVRLIQAFPKDNLLVANAFHVLSKESMNFLAQVDNLDPNFDPVGVNLVDEEQQQQQQNNTSTRGRTGGNRPSGLSTTGGSRFNNTPASTMIGGVSSSKLSMLRAVKLATLHLARPTEHCQGWISLAESVITFLSTVLVAPAYLFAQVIESVREGVVALEDLGEKTTASSVSSPNSVSLQERENIQIKILNRRAQFLFLLGHTCVKHLVSIEEYEKRELAAVSERGANSNNNNNNAAAAGDNNNNPRFSTASDMSSMMMRDSSGSTTATRPSTGAGSTTGRRGGKGKNAAGAGAGAGAGKDGGAGDDAMSKELGFSNAEFQRNKVKDACDRARELTCLSNTHPHYKKITEGVPQQLVVPPVWGKYASLVVQQNRSKFTNTAGIAAPSHLSNDQDGANHQHENSHLSLRLQRAMVTHRSTSTLCLIKLMIASSSFCQKELPLLFTLLQQNDEPWEVKTGIVMGLGDLACVHPNLLQPYMKISSSGFYALLADRDVRVRSVAIQICTHLVLNDMLIVGDHVHTIVRLAADQDPTIRHSAEAFSQYLAVKRQKELHNIIPPLVKALSVTEEIGATNAIVASGVSDEFADNNNSKKNDDNVTNEDAAEDDDNKTSARASTKSTGRLSAAAKKKLEEEEKKKIAEKRKEAKKQQNLRRLPPLSEEDFQQAIGTLLDHVDKGAVPSLITKLCQRFSRYTDTDEEMMQFHRNLAFCLSELPWQQEKEVKTITSSQLFEKYKDWLRDPKIAESFDKIATKARKNIAAGRGIANAGHDAHAAGNGPSPTPGAAEQTERRDKVLLEEWVVKLQDAAAGGVANRPRAVEQDEAAGGGENRQLMMNDDNNVDSDDDERKATRKSTGSRQQQQKNNNKKKNNNRLVDDSTSEEDDASSSSSDDDSSSDEPVSKRRKNAAHTKKKAKPSPKPKKKAGAAKKSSATTRRVKREELDDEIENSSSDDDDSSSSDDSSNDDSDSDSSSGSESSEEQTSRARRRPAAGGKKSGGRR